MWTLPFGFMGIISRVLSSFTNYVRVKKCLKLELLCKPHSSDRSKKQCLKLKIELIKFETKNEKQSLKLRGGT